MRFRSPRHQIADAQQLEYMALLRLQHFSTEDEQIRKQLDYLRWRVHRATLPVTIPDQKLKTKVDELAAYIAAKAYTAENPPGHRQLRELLTAELFPVFEAMRDLYEESDKYEESKIVAPNEAAKPDLTAH